MYETRLPVVFKVSYQARPEMLLHGGPVAGGGKRQVCLCERAKVNVCNRLHSAGGAWPLSRKLLSGVAEKDDIATVLAAGNRQPLAVSRPGKVENQIRFEIRELPGFTALERLHPEVRHAVLIHDVGDAFSVRSKANSAALRSRVHL